MVHASWNLLIARARDPQAATAVAGVIGAVVLLPVAALAWDVGGDAWPYAIASGVIHIGYFALLALAYSRGDLSAVYPLARGSAPVLVLVGAVLLLGESPSALQVAGVVAVGAGVLAVRGLERRDTTGELLGLVVGVTIAAYTVIDKRGVEDASPLAYLFVLNTIGSVTYFAGLARARGMSDLRAELGPVTALAGVGMMAAYGLVLAALQLGPASGVAATRETSILFATAFGAFVLHERVGPGRALGALAIVAGVAAVALG